jgi:hypothetical protein
MNDAGAAGPVGMLLSKKTQLCTATNFADVQLSLTL